MAFTSGKDFRLYTNTGGGTPSYTSLDCESEVTVSINSNLADTTGKCSVWTTGEIATSGWSISVSGKYAAGDAGVDQIRTDILAQTALLVQIKTHNSEVYAGTVLFESFDTSSSYDGVVEFSASGTGTGALTVS